MKKILLPALSLLLFGSAVNAEEVSVTCWETNYWKLYREIFDPVKSDLTINGDDSYTIKNFLNSGFDLKFSVGTGKVYAGNETYKNWFDQSVWESPTLTFYPPVQTESSSLSGDGRTLVKNQANGKDYVCKAIPVDGLSTSSLGNITLYPKKEFEFPLNIARNVSVAEYLGADDAGKHYKIWIGIQFDATLDDDEDYLTWKSDGYAIFDMLLPADPVNVKYVDAQGATWLKDTESVIGLLDDRTSSVTNFLNSGKTITLTTTGKSVGEGRSGIVFGSGFNSSENADSYQALEGATASLLTPDGQAVTGAAMVRPAGCYAEQIEELSYNKARYKVYLDTKVGDATGYTVFEMSGTPIEKGEVCKMTVETTGLYEDEVGALESTVNFIDDNNFVIYNFMNSGFNVPFILSDAELNEEEDEAFDSWQFLDLPDSYAQWYEYRDDSNKVVVSDEYKTIVIPEWPLAQINGSYLDKAQKNVAVNNLRIDVAEWSSNPDPVNGPWGTRDVFHYKDGDKVRSEYNVYFADDKNGQYRVTWSVTKDQSGIEDIVVDGSENAPVEWFNLQGVRVSGESLAPGIYIKRQGSKAVKVLVK